jgi:hypothetical protein
MKPLEFHSFFEEDVPWLPSAAVGLAFSDAFRDIARPQWWDYRERALAQGVLGALEVSGKPRRKGDPIGNHFFKLPFDATTLA